MRVYLPATLPLLARWDRDGAADARAACAVTPSLREWYREADMDELEYSASVAAGLASLRLLAADPAAPRRRVVLVAEVADSGISKIDNADPASAPEQRAGVVLTGTVPVRSWQSLLADGPDAAAVITAAVAALPVADRDDDARFAVDEAVATDLGWYALQELPDLLGDSPPGTGAR